MKSDSGFSKNEKVGLRNANTRNLFKSKKSFKTPPFKLKNPPLL